MRKISALLAIAAMAALSAAAQKHEHRSTWMSAYTTDWPSGQITASTEATQKALCLANLDSLQRDNFTTIYYHVRTMCDAMYDSAYEPWSSYVSPSRGTAPVFDPLDYLVENAHARGIEVYAWLNPYRYYNSIYGDGWGDGELNYENSHPDWLLKWTYTDDGNTRTWTILNPALDEVKQRIVDVIADILSKYDVDGIVFDDYFYQNNLPESYDADNYAEYVEEATAAGETVMSQLDWRRENVNDMVRRVNSYIKSTKPWVRFGISPAGVAGKSEVASQYGLEACPGSDWQYNAIASNPLAWLDEGTIDFISPQVYWRIGATSDFAAITPWWYVATAKFNRHCYISQSLSSFSSVSSLSEYYNEITLTRTSDQLDAPGFVFFPWRLLKSSAKRVDGQQLRLITYLRQNVYTDHSLTPAATWLKADCPGAVTSLSRSGRTLSWEGPENVRYTVYAVPTSVDPDNFYKEAQYLRGISYSTTYEIPAYEENFPEFGIADADLDSYNYAVAILDRYGNEYAPFFVGAETVTPDTPSLTYPVEGETASPLFNFAWTGNSQQYDLIVATDADMTDVVYRKEMTDTSVSSADVWDFEADQTYYCRVVGRSNNAADVSSEVVSFSVDAFRITSIADGATSVDVAPQIAWNSMGDGASYEVVIGTTKAFATVILDTTTTSTSLDVDDYLLSSNTTYYAKVVGTFDGGELETSTVEFTTEYLDIPTPTFVSPTADGETLYSNSSITVAPQQGVVSTRIMICPTTSFSARTSYTGTLQYGDFSTPELSGVRMISTALADGTTYYTRAQFDYKDESGSTVQTDWTDTYSFVYSSDAGVGELRADAVYVVGGDNARLVAGAAGVDVAVYSLDGRQVLSTVTAANGEADLSSLPGGAYVVTARSGGALRTFKLIK